VQESSPLTGELVALDAKSGAIKWQHEFASAAFGATTAVNDVVFTTTYDGRIYAFDASSGRLIWQEALPAGSNTGVTVIGDTVIAPAGLAAAEGQSPQIVAYRLGG
jgi:outer membrane protein assembly factor BamB